MTKILFAGDDDNVVARGLRTLEIPFDRCDGDQLGRVSLFEYDLLVAGMDVPRDALNRQGEAARAFVESGGVILGFRCKTGNETWLPVSLGRDRGYSFGDILAADHPIFTTPNRLSTAVMRTIHDAGSIYNAFCELGDGWLPLASAGRPLNWDKREQRVDGPHYGIVELAHGTGRILLMDMIPAYNWFRDLDGDPEAPGALFFENVLTYALAKAPRRAASRPAPVRPAGLVDDLDSLWALPVDREGDSFDASAWTFETSGPYTTESDRRGVLALRHADAPSAAGNYARATTRLALPTDTRRFSLVWYESDTYCGGVERILGGAEHGQTALRNYKSGHRYKQVLVNGVVVWEADVLGRNPQPTSRRFHRVDIGDAVPAGARTCDVTVRVLDKQGSGDLPFAIEVYYARVSVEAGAFRSPAASVLSGAGVSPEADGGFAVSEGAARLTGDLELSSGRYRFAVRLRDGAYGRSTVSLTVDAGETVAWRLTADDHRYHWFVTPLLDVQRGQMALTVAVDGGEPVAIAEIAAVPERLLRRDGASESGAASRAPETRIPSGPVRFEATVAETAGVARRDEVCVQTFPFARGVLPDARAIRVVADGGEALPVQARTVATWPDGSVKIAATAFPLSVAALGRRTVLVETGEGARASAPATGLVLTEGEGGIELDTGPLQLLLSTTRGTVFEEVRRGDERVLDPVRICELVAEDETGRVARSSESPVTSTEIVERGPLRALIVRKGTLVFGEGRGVDYRLQVEATAGSDALRTQAFIINRSDADEIYLRRWSFRIGHAEGPCRVWLSADRPVAAQPGDVLYQHREDSLTWTGSDGRCDRAAGVQSPGFVRVPGLAFGTRWFWQRFPQAIRFEPGAVRQDFIPAAFDDGDLPTRWAERMAGRTDAYAVGGVGYPQSPGKMGLFRLARGEALRQEIVCVFDGRDAFSAVDSVQARLDAPLRAASAPQYVSETRAYGVIHPADSGLFPDYETSVERFLESYLKKRAKRREYGFENYGDDTFEWGYGPSHTYWSNSEYDHHHGFALQYLRSGDPRWWDEFEKTARFYCDVVVIHYEPDGSSRPQRGGPRHHNYTAMWMASHPDQPWVADHTMKPADSGHAWAQGVVDAWFLTGDPWAGDVLKNVAEWYCRIVEADRYGAGGQERGPGWALVALSALTRATNDERVRAAGRAVADWIVDWQDPVRGVISVPISEQPSYEGGTVFMHGIVGRGLGRWYDVTGDPRVRTALIRLADWLVTEPMKGTGRFWYKQAPNCMTRHSPTSQTVSALTYAFDFTGDALYEEVASALVKGGGADVRALSWYPDALARLAPARRPAEVRLGSDRIVAVPGEDGVTAVAVRNTHDGPVQVDLSIAAAGPFEVAGETRVTVAEGDSVRLPVRVRCGKAPATGRADIVLRLTAAECEPVERAYTVELESVAGVHRIELDAGQAAVTPPATVVREDGTAVVDTPRPADFTGSPLPADSAGRGTATWDVEVENAGEYVLWAHVYWLDGKGNSFYVEIDDDPEQVLGNRGDMQRWIWVRGPVVELAAGTHRIAVRTREEGARLRALWLSSSAADRPAGIVVE